MTTRDEAQGWLVQTLLDKIRSDPYPSATQMALIEKVAEDDWPSIPMLQRIARVAETLPTGQAR